MQHRARHDGLTIDGDLAERLRCVVDALGGHALPLPVIVRALLVEATEQLEARRALEARAEGSPAVPCP